MRNLTYCSVLVVCTFAVAGSPLLAQDWPQWRGPNRDATVNGFTAPQTWPKQLSRQWTVEVGPGDSTPALVGNRLYIFARQGQEEVVLCLDVKTGEELWRDSYEAVTVTGGASRDHYGPRSSPTVAQGRVFTLGVGGVLSSYDASSGDLKWRKNDFPGQWPVFFVAMSPIVVDTMCIVHLGGEENGVVVAYDVESGDQQWKWEGDAPTYSSPVLMTVDGRRQLVVQTASHLMGMTLTGEPLWQVGVSPERRFYSSATPVIDGQTVIYTGQGQGTRAIKVEKTDDGFETQQLWHNEDLGTTYNTPVLKNNLLFGISSRGSNLFCLNANTGKTLWTDTQRYGRYGTIVDLGSVLVALPTTDLIVIEPSGEAYKELARYTVAENDVLAYPVVAGNRIYIRDSDSVTLWTLD